MNLKDNSKNEHRKLEIQKIRNNEQLTDLQENLYKLTHYFVDISFL